jgi:hypothetical protein
VARLFSGIGIRILIIAVIAGGAFVFRDRLSGSAADLKVGDCFDSSDATTIESVQHHPCTDSHNAEVVLVAAHPAAKGAAYPSETELSNFVDTTCATAVVGYVGSGMSLDTLLSGLLYPAEEDWAKGERKITCYITRADSGSMTKSLRAGSQ